MSLAKMMAALEEFTEEVNSEIAPAPTTDGNFAETTAGVDFPQESEAIDDDIDSITTAAKGLEDIINLVEEAPGEGSEPLQPFAQKAVNVALESNDMVVASGNPLAKTADQGKTETKDGVLNKVKEFAAKVWEMLRSFGKKIAEWIRQVWAKYTDRIVKNSNRAKAILGELKSMATRGGAKIIDKSVLAKIATFKNVEVGDALVSVTEYAASQAGKNAQDLSKEAHQLIDVVAGGVNDDGVMQAFLKVLAAGAGDYAGKASSEQAQAIKGNSAGTETYVSEPFFGGYRAWCIVPENQEALQYWNHGITKIDEVKQIGRASCRERVF